MTVELLNSVMEIAQRMIEVGAEIHRVEDSVSRICRAYGVTRVDAYATTSTIVVSVENADGNVLTQTRRVESTGADIDRLDKLNALARRITAQKLDAEQIQKELDRIRPHMYPLWLQILSYGGIAAAFCLFFGGHTLAEVLVALVVGLIVGVIAKTLEHIALNRILARFLCSFISAVMTFAAVRAGLIASPDNVIIGNIMTLIPGVGLTTSLRDLFVGDTVTGIMQSIEAVLLALAIASGYLLTALLFGGVA